MCDDEKPNAVDKVASAFMLMWLLLFRLREIDSPENRFLVLQFGAGMFFAFVIVCVVVKFDFSFMCVCACVLRPLCCSAASIPACRPNEFRCSGGSCIALTFKCDGIVDCPNRDDEVDCPTTGLTFSKFSLSSSTLPHNSVALCDTFEFKRIETDHQEFD